MGSGGAWTGAAAHLGSPVFFKEDCLHRVYVSSAGAHQIVETRCAGIRSGCGRSAGAVGEELFYASPRGIMAYDGSLPRCVSAALGREPFYDAVGAAAGGRYYVSMRSADGARSLFVLDPETGIWSREDDSPVRYMTACGGEVCWQTEDGALISARGGSGEPEGDFQWSAETGIIGFGTVGKKYVSRFELCLQLAEGGEAECFIEYDSDGVRHSCGRLSGGGPGARLLPVRPVRCGHFRIRLSGRGQLRLYSFSKIYEEGSGL